MQTKAALFKHPIHPALVAFPIAFYTATVIALTTFQIGGDPFWFRVGLVTACAAFASALVAAVPGAIDLFSIPKDSPARRTGLMHAGFNVFSVITFGFVAAFLWQQWNTASIVLDGAARLDATGPLFLSSVALASTAVAGALGWKLVQTHHLGIEEDPAEHALHEARLKAQTRGAH
jgi:uncharacterized membrane protein